MRPDKMVSTEAIMLIFGIIGVRIEKGDRYGLKCSDCGNTLDALTIGAKTLAYYCPCCKTLWQY